MESLIGKKVRICGVEHEETPCPASNDDAHCRCWYDGEGCCYCKDPAMLDDTVYTVVQIISDNKVVIVDDPTDPKIIDSLDPSFLDVVDENDVDQNGHQP